MKRIAFVCIVAIVFLVSAPAQGQQRQGQIKGRVSDASGRPVANLTIVFRNGTTGAERESNTDATGAFNIAQLDPGQYTLKSQASQSQTSQTCGACQTQVQPACTTNLNVRQNVAGEVAIATETIVTDTTAVVRSVWGPTEIELLPQPNAISRSGEYFGALNLSLLNPAVTPGDVLQPGVGPAVEGRPNTGDDFLVLGFDNNNHTVPGPLVSVSNEVTNEFSLVYNQETAETGYTTGGNFNLTLASPGNAWHGAFYDYLNNRNLNSSEPAVTGSNELRYDQNRGGGKVGGPIIKNSLFVFANLEYIPLRSNQVSLNQILSPTRAGLNALAFSPGVSFNNLSVLRDNVQVTDTPVAFTTINGVVVPLGIVNTSLPTSQNKWQGIGRLDWHISNVSTLSARYLHNDTGVNAFGPSLQAFEVPGHTRALLGGLSYTTVLGTNVVGSLNGAYNRLDQSTGGGSFTFPGQTAFPTINIQQFGYTLGPNTQTGQTVGNTYQFATGWDWTRGGNHFRFGVDYRDLISTSTNNSLSVGNYTYSSLERYLVDLPPDVQSQRNFGPFAFNGNRNLLYAYIQDSMKWRGMDVNWGLGYQYAQLPSSLRRQSEFSNLNVPGLIDFDEPHVGQVNFAPHLGIAWAPTSSQTVVRGSFGMAYDGLNPFTPGLGPDMRIGTVAPITLDFPGFLAFGGVRDPFTQAGGVSRITPDDARLPYVVNWTASVSHTFFSQFATEVKYVGNHGVHLPFDTIVNKNSVTANSSLPVFFSTPSAATLASLTTSLFDLTTSPNAFTGAGFINPIRMQTPAATSWYNGAYVKISEVFTAGTQFSAQYTYSDTRTEATGTALDLALGRNMEQAPWSRKHVANITGLVDVASMFGPSTGFVHNIIADLSFTGTVSYATRQRLPLITGVDTGLNGNGLGSGVFVNPFGIPGVGTGVTPLTNGLGTVAYLANDPNAQFVAGGLGTFSTDRPTLRLDPTENLDLAVIKGFSAPDKIRIEFRADAYNVFNHPQFTGLPVSTLGTGVTTVPSFLLVPNSNFNNVQGSVSGNPRTFQLALRFIF